MWFCKWIKHSVGGGVGDGGCSETRPTIHNDEEYKSTRRIVFAHSYSPRNFIRETRLHAIKKNGVSDNFWKADVILLMS